MHCQLCFDDASVLSRDFWKTSITFHKWFHLHFKEFSKIFTERLRDAYGTRMGCRSINRFDKLNWRKYNPFRTTIPEQWFSMKFQCESFTQCSMMFYCCFISRFPCLFHQVSEDVSIVLNWCQWLSAIWQSVFNEYYVTNNSVINLQNDSCCNCNPCCNEINSWINYCCNCNWDSQQREWASKYNTSYVM